MKNSIAILLCIRIPRRNTTNIVLGTGLHNEFLDIINLFLCKIQLCYNKMGVYVHNESKSCGASLGISRSFLYQYEN